jgi:5-methyltetrahydropteroyltriglutamate--homocysteine methyltransferase
MRKVKTTVIGSYPVKIDNVDLINCYFYQKPSSWNIYIDNAVNNMIEAGIDIVSDGQTRDPFVNIFVRKLKGCRIRDRPEITGKVEYYDPITIEDQKYVKTMLPKDRELVGLLTGPYTLAKSCVDIFYNDEKELAYDFAKALRQEAIELSKTVDLISIDEPFFSVSMPDYSCDLIKTVIQGVSCQSRLHVCGDVSKILPQIIEIPVQILSHEFKASPHIFNAFKELSFPQTICLGSVRSDIPEIESVNEIKNHIKKGIDVFDEKISQIAPDCGLRNVPNESAFQKLKNLVNAGEQIYGG